MSPTNCTLILTAYPCPALGTSAWCNNVPVHPGQAERGLDSEQHDLTANARSTSHATPSLKQLLRTVPLCCFAALDSGEIRTGEGRRASWPLRKRATACSFFQKQRRRVLVFVLSLLVWPPTSPSEISPPFSPRGRGDRLCIKLRLRCNASVMPRDGSTPFHCDHGVSSSFSPDQYHMYNNWMPRVPSTPSTEYRIKLQSHELVPGGVLW